MRRRRRSRLDSADDFNVSTFGLVAEHHGAEDLEKSGAVTAMERTNSRGDGNGSGSTENSGSVGGGSSVSGGISRGPTTTATRAQAAYDVNQSWMQPAPPREMYDVTGYPALPVFMSVPEQTQRVARRLSPPSGIDLPYLPSPYDAAAIPQNPIYTQPTNAVQGRPSNGNRKKSPTLSPLNVMATPAPQAVVEPSPVTAVSLSNAPMQPASEFNSANPFYSELPYHLPFQQNVNTKAPAPRRGSLLPSVFNTSQPVVSAPEVAQTAGSTSHARALDPSLKPLSASPPPYSNIGYATSSDPADDKAARRLVVRGVAY